MKNKKKTKKSSKKSCAQNCKPRVQSPLDLHNIKSYIEDYAIISKFSHLPFSKREWIETRRYELQFSANKYEHNVGAYLLSHNVSFIHQAPFVINGKIYFLDFFIPSLRIALEVDGPSHDSMLKREKDKDRDSAFKSIGVKTIRISNPECDSPKYLNIRMKAEGIVR
ncbi:MAG TPA: endonuclease domain-containing protein [Candidatus Bacteroides pullicola]|uniref:Endonuclease domain-containing protein n=1 Tax=Candidatus Bacteroides pullicola TaxID=2838475 RepID=A0A9D1ZI20_9BACE|nr:endonuclease domain-containing protein [Candidatus Bacteroides pullicola]